MTPRRSVFGGRLLGVDAFRFLAFLGVVAIHTAGDSLTLRLGELGRWAVPYFFVVAGYFLSADHVVAPRAAIAKVLRRIGPIFLFWLVFYTLLSPLMRQGTPTVESILFSLLNGGPGLHLWFLPSLILSLVIHIALRPRLNWPLLLTLGGLLYGVNMALSSYRMLFPFLPDVDWNPRLGPGPGLIFVSLGAWLREHPVRLPLLAAIGFFVVALVANALEGVLIHRILKFTSYWGMADARLCAIPLGVAALMLALAIPSEWPLVRQLASLSALSLGMYVLHVAVLWAYAATPLDERLPPIAAFGIVSVGTVILTLLLGRTPMRRLLQ